MDIKNYNTINNNHEMEGKSSKGTDRGTELMKISVANGASTSAARATTTCTPEVCRAARQKYQPPDLASDSPWNQKKTYFFIGAVAVFIIWVIIYTILSELKLV